MFRIPKMCIKIQVDDPGEAAYIALLLYRFPTHGLSAPAFRSALPLRSRVGAGHCEVETNLVGDVSHHRL